MNIKRKVKMGDEVIVIAGSSRGKRGTIMAIENDVNRVIVNGVNVKVLHRKGGIITQERSIHISNVMAYSSTLQKGCRIGRDFKDGKKFRFLKQSKEVMAEKVHVSKKQ